MGRRGEQQREGEGDCERRARREQCVDGVAEAEGDAQLRGGIAERAAAPHRLRSGGDGGNAGRAREHEGEECGRGGRAHRGGEVAAVEQGEGARHVLFGDDAGERRERDLPLRDAHGIEEILQPAAEHGEHAVFRPLPHIFEGKGEGEQYPHDDEERRHHRYDLHYKLFDGK